MLRRSILRVKTFFIVLDIVFVEYVYYESLNIAFIVLQIQ